MPGSDRVNKQSLEVWMPFLLALMGAIGLIAGFKMGGNSLGTLAGVPKTEEGYDVGRVEEVIRYIESKYVDDLDSDALIEEAVKSVLLKLDPHSLYLSPEMVKRANEEMEGSFSGLGIESLLLKDTLHVYNVLEDSPADRAGLAIGDQVIYIGDSLIASNDYGLSQIKDMLQLKDGEHINLKVLSLNSDSLVEKKVEIGPVALHSANIGYMVNETTGYIQIKRFSANTYKEFMMELEDMVENQNLQDLIIDVRQNPGGYLPQATDILSQLFSQKGNLLVYTEGKNERLTEYKTTGKSFFPIDNIAVLVDGGSASGSEILAGAIQDWDRGIIVGRRTFGKGLVQEQYGLKNGGALRLTIARYFTPSGRLIQKPYINGEGYSYDQADRMSNGELTHEDKMMVNDSTQYFTLKDQRVVYGGGGIIPDFFVPLDSAYLDNDYRSLIDSAIEFAYIQYREGDFKPNENYTYQSEDENRLVEEYASYLESKKSPSLIQKINSYKPMILNELKACLAGQYGSEEDRVKASNETDPDFIAALKEIQN